MRFYVSIFKNSKVGRGRDPLRSSGSEGVSEAQRVGHDGDIRDRRAGVYGRSTEVLTSH